MNSLQELQELLQLFDPQEKGTISFKDFYRGVRSIIRRRHSDHGVLYKGELELIWNYIIIKLGELLIV